MIDPAALAFDVDGVIADTMHLFLDILGDHYDVHTVRYEDITCYRLDHCLDLDADVLESAVKRILDGRYRATLNSLPGAGTALKRIGEITGRILMVTARPEPGPIGDGLPCLLTELGTASAALLVLGYLASTRQAHLSPATWAIAALAGSLVGFGIRQAVCPSAHTMPHVMLFHAGGVVLAALLGASVSRLPTFR